MNEGSKITPKIIIIFLITNFAFWSLIKLNTQPGLHGDEAWSGLMADHFLNHSIDRLEGMNTYTGILQALLAALFFKLNEPSVFSLRIGTAIFNIMSLLIICYFMQLSRFRYWACLFMVFLCQSALLLTSARVAWEVNTFTFFFIVLLLISSIKIYECKFQPIKKWLLMCFLIINLFGTYNHIIFSAYTAGAFVGLSLHSIYFQTLKFKRLIAIFFIANLNNVVLYLVMNLHDKVFIILPFLAIFIELSLYNKFDGQMFISKIWKIVPKVAVKTSLFIFLILFLCIHGFAYFEALSSPNIFLQNYSLVMPKLLKILLSSFTIINLIYFIKEIWKDFHKEDNSIFSFLAVSFFGIISIYTMKSSYRYFLGLCILYGLFVTFKISQKPLKARLQIYSLAMSMLLITALQGYVFFNDTRKTKPIEFKIGGRQLETSAHFLQKDSLVSFLRKNHVNKINYYCDPYFTEKPVEFYRLISPWPTDDLHIGAVDYDLYNLRNTGFIYYIEK